MICFNVDMNELTNWVHAMTAPNLFTVKYNETNRKNCESVRIHSLLFKWLGFAPTRFRGELPANAPKAA